MPNSKIKYLEKLTDFLDKAVKVPRSYQLKHVNDDNDVISKEESVRRLKIALVIFGNFLKNYENYETTSFFETIIIFRVFTTITKYWTDLCFNDN